MIDHISEYSASRSSRSMDRFMILACAIFVFALCTNFSAAAQNPNLLEQMEGDFSELSNKAISWSMPPEANTDTLAQNEYDDGLWSDSACWELEPEMGYIELVDAETFLPTTIPLCVDQNILNQWQVKLHIYGGYEFVPGETYLWLYQKGECQYVDVVFTKADGACCSDYYYYINFFLPQIDADGDGAWDKLCFDANNMPTLPLPFSVTWDETHDDDLEKEIYVGFCSLWTGCEAPTQQFTISFVPSLWSF